MADEQQVDPPKTDDELFAFAKQIKAARAVANAAFAAECGKIMAGLSLPDKVKASRISEALDLGSAATTAQRVEIPGGGGFPSNFRAAPTGPVKP